MVKPKHPPIPHERAMAEQTLREVRGKHVAAWWTIGALGVAAITGLILHLLHTCGREPNFDEHVILQFTWMIAQGMAPRVDFLCPYPTSGFLLFAAVLKHLPQTPSLFIGLRIFSLVLMALFLAALAWIARTAGRDRWATVVLGLVLASSGEFPTLWEIRFDLGAWALALCALALLLGAVRTWPVFLAALLATFSVMVSPKHAFVVLGMALGFGLSRLQSGFAPALRAVVVAGFGALATLLALTLFQTSIIPDSWHLALMNFRTQQSSEYPVTLFESLFGLIIRDPVASLPIWLGPAFLALAWRSASPRTILTLGGVILGIGLSLRALPCGYPQYVSLIWAMSGAFLPWLVPKAGNWIGRPLFATALAGIALFYAVRELPHWDAKPLMTQIRLQEDLSVICPPGETAVAAPFTHPWFRATPGYVFIDNDTSYRHAVRKERQHFFTADYYFERLEKTRPAYVCGFNLADNTPREYQNATIRYLVKHQTNYTAGSIPYAGHINLPDGHLPLYIRNDIVAKMPGSESPPHRAAPH